MKKALIFSFLFAFQLLATGQDDKVEKQMHVFDGYIIAGYVDQGAYLNFTGPNFNLKWKKSTLVLGMLPSLRLIQLEENNRLHLFPSLGTGITYSYKNIAIQLPFYYNSSTDLHQAKWNIGFGLGYYLNYKEK
ncbi:MAG: hypothetical protein JJT77_11345 [Crocinitomicaceae bacterium]|nr:hypothetical protein [Crocinitomicaceae bacterium]